jgi:PP-loop superfamily ATP-utilizing enzyme
MTAETKLEARSKKLTTNTIAVAMSGGVDSSTVAAMLRAEGHNVVGLTRGHA